MKNSLFGLFVALAVCIAFHAVPANAQTGTTGDGFIWSASNSQVTITGYNGAGGAVVIPATITVSGSALPVVSIGDFAFWFTDLTSVTIPVGVTSIGYEAFFQCTSLTSVTIFGSVTSMGGNVFYGCTHLRNVTISDGFTSIGPNAFYGTRLTGITIPASVTSIGVGAFTACSELAAIIVDASNPSFISVDGVLFNKSQSTLVRYPEAKTGNYLIPNGVTSIGDYAFSGCTRLTSVTIPNGVTSIGGVAFYGCTRLASVTIPSSVTSIGGSAFLRCTHLTSVTIPNSVSSIGNWTFGVCTSLTSVTIPSSVTSIGNWAFGDCTSLTSVTIPSSVTSIGDETFSRCTRLTSVTIPNGVTSIGDYAFYGCTRLASVTIPSSVTSIGDYAFSECTGLEGAYFMGNAPAMGLVFVGEDMDFIIYFQPGATGFWTDINGYPCAPDYHPLPVARKGDSAPGIIGALFSTIGQPAMNAQSHIAFAARVSGSGIDASNNQGIWADDAAGARQLVIRTGTAAPDATGAATSAVFKQFSDPVYSGSDAVAFIGTLRQRAGGVSGINDTGVWSTDGGTLHLVAREGGYAPGCGWGVVFSHFKQIALPDQGGALIFARLSGSGVGPNNDHGIWAVDTAGQLQLIAREGRKLGGQTIKKLTFLPSPTGVGGQTRSFSQTTGDLVYSATFIDGSSGIFKVVFP
jgi:hypothetical protein